MAIAILTLLTGVVATAEDSPDFAAAAAAWSTSTLNGSATVSIADFPLAEGPGKEIIISGTLDDDGVTIPIGSVINSVVAQIAYDLTKGTTGCDNGEGAQTYCPPLISIWGEGGEEGRVSAFPGAPYNNGLTHIAGTFTESDPGSMSRESLYALIFQAHVAEFLTQYPNVAQDITFAFSDFQVTVDYTPPEATIGRLSYRYVVPVMGDYDIRRDPAITISDERNDAPNSAQFTVQTTEPECGQAVRIMDPATRRSLHTGSIVRTKSVVRETDVAWASTATDYSWLLNRRRPFGTWTDTPADEIAQDMLDGFSSGFTGARITPGLPAVTISFDGTQSFTACLGALCQAAGGLIFSLDVRDLVLGFDAGVVVTEDDFSGNATLLAADVFVGDGATTAWELTEQLIGHHPEFTYSGWITRYGYASIAAQQYAGGTHIEAEGAGRVGATPPTPEVPVAPSIAVGAYVDSPYGSLDYLFLRVGFLFDDGTESFASGVSNQITLGVGGTSQGWTATIPVGGARVVGRRVYVHFQEGNAAYGGLGILDVLDNTTTALVANRYIMPSTTDYANLSVRAYHLLPGSTLSERPLSWIGTYSGAQEITFQYDLGTNVITIGAGLLGHDIPTNTVSLWGFPPPPGRAVRVDYYYLNPSATSTFPLTHQLVPTPGTGDIGLGYVTYNNGSGPLDETLTEPVDGGVWTWDSGTNAITRTTGAPATPASGLANISIVYSTNNGVYEVDIDTSLLLLDPPPSRTVDITQLRNRIRVLGIGTTLRAAAGLAATGLSLNDTTMFLSGGKALIGTDVVDIDTVFYGAVPAVTLLAPTVRAYAEGTPVRLLLQFDDAASQADRAAIEGGDGVHEGSLSFTGWVIGTDVLETVLGDRATAETAALTARGQTELATWAYPQETIEYATRDQNSRSGALVTFDLPELGIIGTYKIQSVVIDQVNVGTVDAEVLVPRFTVSASAVRFEFVDLLRKVLISDGGGGSGTSGGGFGGGGAVGGGGGGAPLIPEYRGETPSGAVNGSNALFTLAHVSRVDSLMVYLNGLRQFEGQDYTVTTASTFTMVAAPLSGDRLVVDYRGY